MTCGDAIISAGKDRFLGIVPGQSLRLTAANPIATGRDRQKFKPLFAFTIFDAAGKVIVEGDEVALEPASGRTVVHLLQKPKEIVVVGSKIEP